MLRRGSCGSSFVMAADAVGSDENRVRRQRFSVWARWPTLEQKRHRTTKIFLLMRRGTK